MDELLNKIKEGVTIRKSQYKFDAYFDLPSGFTVEQIKEIKKRIEENNTIKHSEENIYCRLYGMGRLQVCWHFSPKSSPQEFMMGIPAITDIDT